MSGKFLRLPARRDGQNGPTGSVFLDTDPVDCYTMAAKSRRAEGRIVNTNIAPVEIENLRIKTVLEIGWFKSWIGDARIPGRSGPDIKSLQLE
ncbi:hypothetical protein TNCV_3658461 [Trichonephila clavipes]|nr:hypothetical protein TNCV_3658461 [Trichonephila clavipes]